MTLLSRYVDRRLMFCVNTILQVGRISLYCPFKMRMQFRPSWKRLEKDLLFRTFFNSKISILFVDGCSEPISFRLPGKDYIDSSYPPSPSPPPSPPPTPFPLPPHPSIGEWKVNISPLPYSHHWISGDEAEKPFDPKYDRHPFLSAFSSKSATRVTTENSD
jgi:hypothetical protein